MPRKERGSKQETQAKQGYPKCILFSRLKFLKRVMVNRKGNSAQEGFLNKLFSKNSSNSDQSKSNSEVETPKKKKPSQPITRLFELYDSTANSYSYFKSLCFDNESTTSNGIQGLKSLVTELRYELQVLNRKYPYLVVEEGGGSKDDVKVFNALHIIIKKSEAILAQFRELQAAQVQPRDSASNQTKSSSSSVQNNKMFNKRIMRSLRAHSDTRPALSTTGSYQQQGTAGGSEKSVLTYKEQKRMGVAREERRQQRLQHQPSYSDSRKKVSLEVDRKSFELESVKGKSADPFAGFADEGFAKEERKSISRNQSAIKLQPAGSNTSAKKMANNSAINVSLQAAALAAQNGQPKKMHSAASIKPKRVLATAEGSEVEVSEEDPKSQKDILEDDILASTPQIDYKVGKQIFQEILVGRSSQRPITWDDIIGLNNCKQQLQETVVFPFLRPDLFSGLREPINGLLLYGPPGTGKTMLAKCVAYQTESTFFNVSVSSITSKFLGESEKLVRGLFTLAAKLSPSIIFIDEIDSILGSRTDDSGAAGESSRRFKNEFLTQWSNISYSLGEDGSFNRVLVLGCTNLPWVIDDAARRRFQKRIYCPIPSLEDRTELMKTLLAQNDIHFTDEHLQELAILTEGFSNSDLVTLCKDASMEPIRELIRKGDNSILSVDKKSIRGVTLEDFKTSMTSNKVKGSVNLSTIKSYDQWTEQFGS